MSGSLLHQPLVAAIGRSLLLLFLSFAAFLAFFSEELALCLEPDPASLDIPCSIVHRHLLSNLGFGLLLLERMCLLALFLLLCVGCDFGLELFDLLHSLRFLLLDYCLLFFDALFLLLANFLLCLGLASKQLNTVTQMSGDSAVNFSLDSQHALKTINFFLELSFLLLVHTVFT